MPDAFDRLRSGRRKCAHAPAANKAAEHSADKKTPEKSANAPGAEAKPEMVLEEIQIDSGEQGRGYDEGVVSTPLKALWSAKAQLAFGMVRKAMDIYKAGEGHAPKTYQEFMDRIINENHIQLPTLPPGQRYVYDPQKEKLLLEKPKAP